MCFLNLNPRSESRIFQFRITAIMLNKHNSIQAIDRTID